MDDNSASPSMLADDLTDRVVVRLIVEPDAVPRWTEDLKSLKPISPHLRTADTVLETGDFAGRDCDSRGELEFPGFSGQVV